VTKRLLAGLLWTYVVWYGWSVVAWMIGLPDQLGPFVGLAAGLFVAMDPMHRIWSRGAAPARATTTSPVLDIA
jgi:hypothetical protein